LPNNSKKTASSKKPNKTFLLGVGCQKGGTSWLHSYLHSHPNGDFGLMKEYHVLDVLFSPYNERFLKRRLRKLNKYIGQLINGTLNQAEMASHDAGIRDIKLVGFYQNIENYYDYFDELYEKSADTTLVGDITPAYAALTSEDLRTVKEALEARGFDVKVIFLMRDPIDRNYSASRMEIRDRLSKGKKVKKTANEMFTTKLTDIGAKDRTNYPMTINNLEAVFDPDNIHFGFFEDLFTDAEVKKITDFLGIEYVEADFGNLVNASPRTEDLSQENIEKARTLFASTYDFIAKKFPEKDIKTLWKNM